MADFHKYCCTFRLRQPDIGQDAYRTLYLTEKSRGDCVDMILRNYEVQFEDILSINEIRPGADDDYHELVLATHSATTHNLEERTQYSGKNERGWGGNVLNAVLVIREYCNFTTCSDCVLRDKYCQRANGFGVPGEYPYEWPNPYKGER